MSASTRLKPVTDDSFAADVLASAVPVIVEFWAPWCGPCRMVGPVLEAIAEEYAGTVEVVKLNTDENPQSMRAYGVMAVPTIILFTGGEVARQVTGAKSKSALVREFADFIWGLRKSGVLHAGHASPSIPAVLG